MSAHEGKGAGRATVADAIAAWEAKGPTSLTVALMADALYGVRDTADEWAALDIASLGTLSRPTTEALVHKMADDLRTRPTPPAQSAADPEPGQ